MATYKGKAIMLNQQGIDTLNEMAQALLGYPGDAEAVCNDLMGAYNQYGEGLGLSQSGIEEIVRGYQLAMQSISKAVVDVSQKMVTTANLMQAYVNSISSESADADGHGPMGPNQKVLRRQ